MKKSKLKVDSGRSTPEEEYKNKQANIKLLQKHNFTDRISLLDDMDPESSLCKNNLLGFYNMLYVISFFYFIVNPLITYQQNGYFLETKLLDMITGDFFMCIITWPLFYFWSHIALLIQYLALQGVSRSVIFTLQHASQLVMFIYAHYLVLTRNFFMGHGFFITFQSCIFFMKMHSYTMTNYKMRREWIQAGRPIHNNQYQYPNNINLKNFNTFIAIPVLVYEPVYPRRSKIRVGYALVKMINTVAMLFLAYMIASSHLMPIVENVKNMSLIESIFMCTLPMICLCLIVFNMVFENYCNFWAEITYFGDRLFYTDWWNSSDFEEFNRKWNRPVYEFLYRHVYLEMIFEFQFSVKQAQLLTFVFSAMLHEYSLCVSLQQISPIMIMFMLIQLPVVWFTRKIKGTKFGNIFFWWGIIQGLPLIMNLYLRFKEFTL